MGRGTRLAAVAALVAVGATGAGADSVTSFAAGAKAERAAARKTSGAAPLLGLGLMQLEQGRTTEAVASLRQALQHYKGGPAEPASLLELGRAFGKLKERTHALTAFDLLLQRFPMDPLADDAQFEKGLLEARDMLTPDRLREVFEDFAFHDPLGLDFDALTFLVGFSEGYRLDGLDRALIELRKTWKTFPAGDRAPDALVAEALNRAFLLGDREEGRRLLEQVRTSYPGCAYVGLSLLSEAFLVGAAGKPQDALSLIDRIEPAEGVAPTAAFLAGWLTAYRLNEPRRALAYFGSMGRLARDESWRAAALYHQAMVHFTCTHGFAEAQRLLKECVALVATLDTPRAGIVSVGARFLQGTVDGILAEVDLQRARLRYALYFQGTGHAARAAQEFKDVLGQDPAPELVARLQFELGVTLHDDLGRPREAAQALAKALRGPGLSEDRRTEAGYRVASLPASDATTSRARLERLATGPGLFADSAARGLARLGGATEGQRRKVFSSYLSGEGVADEARARVLRDLAEMFEREGNYPEAMECYGRLLTVWPSAGEALERLERKVALATMERSLSDRGSLPEDATLLTAIARIHEQTGDAAGALQELRRAARAAAGTSSADAVALALLRAQVKGARSTAHALTLLDEFQKKHQGRTAEAVEALVLRAQLLERRVKELGGDKKEQAKVDAEAASLRQGLLERGVAAAESAEALARRALDRERPEEALAFLERAAALKTVPASLLRLKAELLLRLGRPEARLDVLERLARDEADTADGTWAAQAVRAARVERLEKGLAGLDAPNMLAARLQPFVDGAAPEELQAARGLLERLAAGLEGQKRLTPELAVLLGRALVAGGAPGRGAALLKTAAARPPTGEEGPRLTLEAARALLLAKDPATAYQLLGTIEELVPEAPVLMADLQLGTFGDPKQAKNLLVKLLKRPAVPAATLAQAYLKAVDLVEPPLDASGPPRPGPAVDNRLGVLRHGLARLPAAEHFPLRKRLAELESLAGRHGAAVAAWQQAAAAAPSVEERLPCSARAVDALVESKQFPGALAELNRLLAAGAPPEWRERFRAQLRETSSREQIATLRRSLNWDDPESARNRSALLQMAELYVSPLGDLRSAEALLNQLLELYPGSSAAAAARAQKERLPLLARLKAMEAAPTDEQGLYRLARTYEDEAKDPSRAAVLYERLLEKYPQSAYAAPARMYLVRLYSLVLDRREAARTQLELLLGEKATDRLAPRLVAMVNLRASLDKAADLRRKVDGGSATAAELVRLGELAAQELAEPATVRLAVDRLAARPEGREQAARLALLAASALRPEGLMVPGGADRLGFLRRALELAPTPELRARSQLLLASELAAGGTPRDALAGFQRAVQELPGSPEAEEALFRSAELLEGALDDPDRALGTWRRLAREGQDPRLVEVASTRAEALGAQEQVRRTVDDASQAAADRRSPSLYFHAGRRLEKDTKDLEAALACFRTYLRLGKNPSLQAQAHRSAAELLVRLERPKEALDELQALLSLTPPGVDQDAVRLRMAEVREVNMADYAGAEALLREVARGRSPGAKDARAGLQRLAGLKKELQRSQTVGLAAESASADVKAIRQEFLRGRVRDWQGAVAALRDKLREVTEPEGRAPLLLELGSTLDNELKQYDDALEAYDEFLRTATDQRKKGDVQLRKGDVLALHLGRHQDAVDVYAQFLDTYFSHPRRVEVMLKVAELKESKLDRAQEALDAYRNIAESYPRSGYDEKALVRLAFLRRSYFADFPGAIEAYRNIVDRFPFGPFAPEAQYTVARIYEVELGDLVQAKLEYEKLINAYPSSPLTAPAREALIRIQNR